MLDLSNSFKLSKFKTFRGSYKLGVRNELLKPKLQTDSNRAIITNAELSMVAWLTNNKAIKYEAGRKKFDQQNIIDLVQFLPPIVKQRNNTAPHIAGPNCWNATLNWFFPRIGVRYSDEYELDDALDKHFVHIHRKELKLGDVIALRRASGMLVHSAIYIGNEIIWHKYGMAAYCPWQFNSFHEIADTYAVDATHITFHRLKRIQKRLGMKA